MDVKFRTLKYRLKKKLFGLAAKRLNEANNNVEDGEQEMNYSDEELLQALDLIEAPEYFIDHQWQMYKSHLRTPAAKKMSLNGKRARGDQVHIHTTGARSFAWGRDAYKVKYKKEPNDVVFFGRAHTTREGSFVTEASRKFMAQAKGELSRKTSAISGSGPADTEVEAKIARDIIQKLRPRGVTGHGAGVKKSQVSKFSIEYRRMRGEAISSEKRLLLDKVDCQCKTIEAQSKQIEFLTKKNEAQSKKLESQSKKLESQSKQIESLTKKNETQSKQIESLSKENETQSIKLNSMEEKMNLFMGELQLFKTAFPDIYGKSNTLSCDSHGDYQ